MLKYLTSLFTVLKKYSMEMLNKFIYVKINNPFKTWWKAKKYFKRPKIRFNISIHNPINYVKYYARRGGLFILLDIQDVSWKYKYNDISFEYEPYINIVLFSIFNVNIRFAQNYNNRDYTLEYWESILMYVYKNTSLLEALKYSLWEDMDGNKIPITNICLKKQW